MNYNVDARIEETMNIIEDGISSDGFPIFVLERELEISYNGSKKLVFGTTDDLIFYTSDEKIINNLRKKLAKQEEKDYVNEVALRKFLRDNKQFLIDNTVKPLEKLDTDAADAYVNLTTNYKNTLKNSEYGVCHLIKNDEFLIFRCWFDGFNADNPNIGLKGLYDNPINTIEEVLERNAIVESLYSKGEIEPEYIVKGNAVDKLRNHILAENKQLPTNYQHEQDLILTEFSNIEKYGVTRKMNNGNLQITLNTDKFGDIRINIPTKKENKIIIKYNDTKEEINGIKDILIKLHFDRTKKEVKTLSQKIKF